MISFNSSSAAPADCCIIGGGIIGLSIARRLAAQGLSIALFDKSAPGTEASHAAGGMLCPRLEFEKGSQLSEMGEISLQLYPDYARELEEETGLCVDLRLDGVITPLSREEAPGSTSSEDAIPRLVDGDALRELEPGISPEITRALYYEDEGSIDNRAITAALAVACKNLGVRIYPDCEVLEILVQEEAARGVRTREGDFSSAIVINSAGAWAGKIAGEVEQVDINPVKGQMLMLDCNGFEEKLPRHTIYSHQTYLVPRRDGRVIVGATVEDKGFDKSVEPAAIEALHQKAAGMFPFLGDIQPRESWAGLRPMGKQDVPYIGALSPSGYYAAVGHYRNGILLAPLTQELMAREILGTTE